MAIAAQQESPHRDIDNDVDFMTTGKHAVDIQAIQEEVTRRGIDKIHLNLMSKKQHLKE